MAALDRRLRSGETWLRNAQVPLGLAQALGQFMRGYRQARRQPDDPGDTEPAPSN